MATKDGRSQIWYADGNGNVEGYTETVGDIAEKIISTYNEHFGTDIQLWTPETKTLQVGDPIPNWNAYEKILLPSNNKFRFKPSGSSAYVAGFVENENAFIYTNDSDNTWRLGPEGQIWGSFGTISDLSTQAKQLLLNEYGIEFDVIDAYVENWEQGQTIPNWESYKTLE